MPNYIWEKVDKILDLIMLLSPIIFLLILVFFIFLLISMIKFHRKHNGKLREMEEFSRKNKDCIEEQRKKHFPKE